MKKQQKKFKGQNRMQRRNTQPGLRRSQHSSLTSFPFAFGAIFTGVIIVAVSLTISLPVPYELVQTIGWCVFTAGAIVVIYRAAKSFARADRKLDAQIAQQERDEQERWDRLPAGERQRIQRASRRAAEEAWDRRPDGVPQFLGGKGIG